MAFGENYSSAEDLTESINPSTTFVQKLRLTTTSVPAGDYLISWSYTWGNENTFDDTLVRIQQDDSTDLWNAREEPKDSGTDQRNASGGFAQVTLTAGVHTFDMDFATSDTNEDARIQQSRMMFWRVD